MRALVFDGPQQDPYITQVALPTHVAGQDPNATVVIKVEATGLCRSDWHAWMGHDDDITNFPHTPGHEFAGTIHHVGANVKNLGIGDRVIVPFICGCGLCSHCTTGNAQVCPNQWQPGFNGPGSFAEFVAIPRANFNVVKIPDSMTFEVAASLGCRFATSYRALILVRPTMPTDTVAIFGCGGVGLAAIMIAKSRGARVIAVDISQSALSLARTVGADYLINSQKGDPTEQIRSLTDGGADVSVDALGSIVTVQQSVESLRPQGDHLQIGLLPPRVIGAAGSVPMHTVIGRELHLHGVHGMSAAHYPLLLSDIARGVLSPQLLISERISLEQAPEALMSMNKERKAGMTVIVL